MPDLGLRLASAASLVLLPALAVEGRRVRRDTPRLPEAAGPREGVVPGADPPLRLLVLGESTAAGVGAGDHGAALGGQVSRALSAATGRAVAWRVLGRNGATAHATRRDLLEPASEVAADVAVIALGVNDTLRFHAPARWTRDLAALVEAVRGRCGAVPVVLSAVPPVGRFPALPQPLRGVLGLRARLLDRAAARFAAAGERVVHVPMPPVEGVEADGFFCEDRFHPSPRGYALWGAALGRAAATLLLPSRREGSA